MRIAKLLRVRTNATNFHHALYRSQAVVFNLANDTQTGNQSLAFPYQNNATVYGAATPVSAANFMIYPIYSVCRWTSLHRRVYTDSLPL